jgi:hypothetical protein
MSCPHEERTLRAAARPGGDAWLDEHTRSCAGCLELRELSRWMNEMEETEEIHSPRLPSAGQIWWKAQVAAREAAARKALKPLRVVESAGLAVMLLAAGGTLLAAWRGLPVLLRGSAGAASGMTSGSISAGLVLTIAVAAFIASVAVHRLLARD